MVAYIIVIYIRIVGNTGSHIIPEEGHDDCVMTAVCSKISSGNKFRHVDPTPLPWSGSCMTIPLADPDTLDLF